MLDSPFMARLALDGHSAQWRFGATFISAHYPVDYSVL